MWLIKRAVYISGVSIAICILSYVLVACAGVENDINTTGINANTSNALTNDNNGNRNYHIPPSPANSFERAGRFVIKNAHHGYYGNFTWRKSANGDQVIDFTNSLGGVVAQITIYGGHDANTARAMYGSNAQTASKVILATPNKEYNDSEVAAMVAHNFGLTVPVAYLSYWFQGLSLPNVAITHYWPDGFSQLGFRVAYLKWHDINAPQLIMITRDNKDDGINSDIIIKFLVSEYDH